MWIHNSTVAPVALRNVKTNVFYKSRQTRSVCRHISCRSHWQCSTHSVPPSLAYPWMMTIMRHPGRINHACRNPREARRKAASVETRCPWTKEAEEELTNLFGVITELPAPRQIREAMQCSKDSGGLICQRSLSSIKNWIVCWSKTCFINGICGTVCHGLISVPNSVYWMRSVKIYLFSCIIEWNNHTYSTVGRVDENKSGLTVR